MRPCWQKRQAAMLAIDTNIVVRSLTDDDPKQSAQARELIETQDVFVSSTVFLETGWVLRRVYGLTASQIITALRGFAGLPRVSIEDPESAAQALDWMAAGMDFADAVHLSKSAGCSAMVSFDKRFARMAGRLGTMPVRPPSAE